MHSRRAFNIIAVLSFNTIATTLFAFEWPYLETGNSAFKLHPKIINSMFTKPQFTYRGHTFSLINDDTISEEKNLVLDAMKSGKKVKIVPVRECTKTDETCRYQAFIDDSPLLNADNHLVIFTIRATPSSSDSALRPLAENPQQISSSTSEIITLLAQTSELTNTSPTQLLDQIFDDTTPLNLGQGHTPSPQFKALIDKYSDNEVVGTALDIIKAADWADFLDVKNLAIFIKMATQKPYYTPVELSAIIERITEDKNHLKVAAQHCKDCSVPFKAQISQMIGDAKGNAGALFDAISLINRYPDLRAGSIALPLQNIKGRPLLALKTALFYIANLVDPSNFILMQNRLNGFYRAPEEGSAQLKTLLAQTLLMRDAEFSTPACAYIKNADKSIVLVGANDTSKDLSMIFTDCSGFVLNIIKKLFPEEKVLQDRKNNVTTYHLAALFDILANEVKESTNFFYDNKGNTRLLTSSETGAITNLTKTPRKLAALRRVFEPVLDIQNLQTGDILIKRHPLGFNDPRSSERSGSEGHALVVVDPNVDAPSCVELTSFKTLGYGWKKVDMTGNKNCRYRILRFRK